MKAKITKYDEELVQKSRVFLRAAEQHPESTALLDRYGFSAEERARGHLLIDNAEKSFEWEHAGKAWNFLSPTPERREKEAREWYADAVRRYVRSCLKEAEAAAGWTGTGSAAGWSATRKLTLGTLRALPHVARAASPRVMRELRAELRENVERARGERPEGAPPPKDTTLVELRGWYERWHLLAQRVFRGRDDLLAPFGLSSGKAPPRLRGKAAQIKYGERAASLSSASDGADASDEELGLAEPVAPSKPARADANGASQSPRGAAKTLPIVR
jgi:hypothetical protein